MTIERGSIHMPIATAVTAILVLVYIFLLGVGRAGKWLGKFCRASWSKHSLR